MTLPPARIRSRHAWSRKTTLTIVMVCLLCIAPTRAQEPSRHATPPSLAFISDTQAPLVLETIRLRADNNEEATRVLFRCIAGDSTCMAVFHLGDFVSMGWSASAWRDFDEKSAPLRNTSIPLYPALGNHEYMLWGPVGKALFEQRFPAYKNGWYVQRIEGIGVVILNSNFTHLADAEQAEQEQWYEDQLRALDADTSVAVVVVGCHHSPFTNSTIVDPSEEVQQRLVPPFFRSRKAVLFLSGHAHASEHFKVGGKDFVVLGGGGGLLHPLLTGGRQRWVDLFSHEGERSVFHYLRIVRDGNALQAQVITLANDQTPCTVACGFTVTKP